MSTEKRPHQKFLIFFIPNDLKVALVVSIEDYSSSPRIEVAMATRLAELQGDRSYTIRQRKRTESPKQFAARVFEIEPEEVVGHPIASVLFREIAERTQHLEPVGRGK